MAGGGDPSRWVMPGCRLARNQKLGKVYVGVAGGEVLHRHGKAC